jgi:hypothetical protein
MIGNIEQNLPKLGRKRGMMGKGGDDLSHTKSGRLVKESPSKNSARNGHNGKPQKNEQRKR